MQLQVPAWLAASAMSSTLPFPKAGIPQGQYGGDTISFADEAFEKFITYQMKEWHAPGLSISIIEGDKTWSKGFGYATLYKHPVTPSTLFYCGSMTKSLTAAGLSLLVDDKANLSSVTWTSRLSALLGEDFALSDSWATNHTTIEDALCHRTGYSRHDYSGPFGNSSLDLMRTLRHLDVPQEPRVQWQYSNMMYGVLGYLIERLSQSKLDDFFRDRLWHPMGMLHTFLHPGDALASGGQLAHAYYYNNDTNTFGTLPRTDEPSVAGAGMAISSVLDWSRYLRHMIEETGPISKAGHTALKAPHMVSEQDKRIYSGTEFYGLGWASNVVQNEAVWYHSGRVGGMLSYMAFVPSRKFGFVVMLNTESVAALDSVFSATLFKYLGEPAAKIESVRTGWYDLLKGIDNDLRNCSARLYTTTADPETPSSIKSQDGLVGSYYDAGYGFANVTLRCDDFATAEGSPAKLFRTPAGCRLAVPRSDLFGKRVSFQLQHVSGDDWMTWLFVDDYDTVRRPSGCYRAQFKVDKDGKVDLFGLDIRMEGDHGPLVWFKRQQ